MTEDHLLAHSAAGNPGDVPASRMEEPEIPETKRVHSGDPFPDTIWTRIANASDSEHAEHEESLRVWCELYQQPLAYVIRGQKGVNPNDVGDLLNEFFQEWLRRERFVKAMAKFEQQGLRLRDFLRREMKSFLINQHRRAMAKKRGADRASSLDEMEDAASALEVLQDNDSPDLGYQKAWARAVLSAAAIRAREMWLEIEKKGLAYALPFDLIWPLFAGEAKGQREVAAASGTGKTNVTAAVAKMRETFTSALTKELEETLGTRDPEVIREELEGLRMLLD